MYPVLDPEAPRGRGIIPPRIGRSARFQFPARIGPSFRPHLPPRTELPPRNHPIAPLIALSGRGSGANSNTTRGRNALESFIMTVDPNFKPATDEELFQGFREFGMAEDDIPGAIQEYNDVANENMEQWGGSLPVIGKKPQPGDTNFQVVCIPSTNPLLAIRIFDGGFEVEGRPFYFFDFFDLSVKKPVNTPVGFRLQNVGGLIPMQGPVVSFENTLGVASHEIPDGEERFWVPQGSRFRLVRRNLEDFYFAMPMRNVGLERFAMPVPFSNYS